MPQTAVVDPMLLKFVDREWRLEVLRFTAELVAALGPAVHRIRYVVADGGENTLGRRRPLLLVESPAPEVVEKAARVLAASHHFEPVVVVALKPGEACPGLFPEALARAVTLYGSR